MPQHSYKETSKPHYHGHRDRLRNRFYEMGEESLQDYEVLELILFSAIPRRDVKPIAKDLLMHFGSIAALMQAPVESLLKIKGISKNTALFLKSISELSKRSLKQELVGKPLLNSWSSVLEYCHATMAHQQIEKFRILFLNKKNHMLADEVQQHGTIDHTPAYPREVIKRALELGASALVLVHNHPSGDHRPSEDDVDVTRAIIRAGEPLGIKVHDHIIVSSNGYSSLKSLGLI